MNTKNLTVLALVAVVVLTGALIVSISGEDEGRNVVQREQGTVSPLPPDGTMTGAAAQTSAEVVSDNIQTSVQVQ